MSGLLAVGLLAMGCGGSETEVEEEGSVQAMYTWDACRDACYATYRQCMIAAGGDDLEAITACVEERQACFATCP
jgi:hypothetical protein